MVAKVRRAGMGVTHREGRGRRRGHDRKGETEMMELADHTINIVHVCDYIRMPGSEMNLLKHFPMQSPSGIFNCSCSAEILVNDPASDVFRLLGERNHDLCNCCL